MANWSSWWYLLHLSTARTSQTRPPPAWGTSSLSWYLKQKWPLVFPSSLTPTVGSLLCNIVTSLSPGEFWHSWFCPGRFWHYWTSGHPTCIHASICLPLRPSVGKLSCMDVSDPLGQDPTSGTLLCEVPSPCWLLTAAVVLHGFCLFLVA
jgi:hypothetical protein